MKYLSPKFQFPCDHSTHFTSLWLFKKRLEKICGALYAKPRDTAQNQGTASLRFSQTDLTNCTIWGGADLTLLGHKCKELLPAMKPQLMQKAALLTSVAQPIIRLQTCFLFYL